MTRASLIANRVIGVLTGIFAGIAAAGVLAITGYTVINVLRRNATGAAFENIVGFGEVSVAAIALLGVAHAQRRGAHIRSTALLDRMPRRLVDVTEILWRLLIAAFVVWMVQATWERAQFSVDIDESRFGTVPIWPARIAIVASLILLALELLLESLERTLALFGLISSEAVPDEDASQEVLEVTL